MHPVKKILLTSLLFLIALPPLNAQKNQECLLPFAGGTCLVKVYNGYGVMKKNKFIIPAYFDTITEFHADYFLAVQSGKKGVFDKKGKMLVPVMFQHIAYLKGSDGLFEVQSTGVRAIFIRGSIANISGMGKAMPTLLASKTELTMHEYLAYLQYRKDNKDADWKKYLPDTSKMDQKTIPLVRRFINEKNVTDQNYIFHYEWHTNSKSLSLRLMVDENNELTKELLKIPLTGISHEQILQFSAWKTKFFNENLNPFLENGIRVQFRLPKINEWEDIAMEGLRDPREKKNNCRDSITNKKVPSFYFKSATPSSFVTEAIKKFGNGIIPAENFSTDENQIYQMFGNVAEMVNEKGLCKGGSYMHYAKQCAINKTLTYQSAQPWLGCRLICDFQIQ